MTSESDFNPEEDGFRVDAYFEDDDSDASNEELRKEIREKGLVKGRTSHFIEPDVPIINAKTDNISARRTKKIETQPPVINNPEPIQPTYDTSADTRKLGPLPESVHVTSYTPFQETHTVVNDPEEVQSPYDTSADTRKMGPLPEVQPEIKEEIPPQNTPEYNPLKKFLKGFIKFITGED